MSELRLFCVLMEHQDANIAGGCQRGCSQEVNESIGDEPRRKPWEGRWTAFSAQQSYSAPNTAVLRMRLMVSTSKGLSHTAETPACCTAASRFWFDSLVIMSIGMPDWLL